MSASEQTINVFQTRTRQMILRFKEAKAEIEQLYDMLEQQDKELKELRKQLEQSQKDYASLKAARVVEVSDGDIEETKKRIARLVRDVNKCIAILSE